MKEYNVPDALTGFVSGALNNIAAWLQQNYEVDHNKAEEIIGEWLVSLAKTKGTPVVLGKHITEALEIVKDIDNVTVQEFGLTLLVMSEDK